MGAIIVVVPNTELIPPSVFNLARIRLRRQKRSDAEAMFECASDLDVARYMSWPLATSLSEVAERIGQRDERWDAGKEFCWAITLAEDDRAIGAISCRVDGDCIDFGFLLNRRHWGNGYATDAARAVVDWARSVPTIRRVWATCDAENVASARILEKVGLSREGTRAIVRPNLSNEPRNAFVYAWER